MTYFKTHKRYFAHFFCCCFFVFIGTQKLGGMFLLMGIPFFVLGCVFKLFEIRKVDDKKQWLRDFRNKLLMWCTAFTIVFFVHQHYKKQAREAANEVVSKIERFHTKTGTYPTTKNLDEHLLKQQYIFYRKNGANPSLIYRDTFMAFATYHYDFAKKEWTYWAD